MSRTDYASRLLAALRRIDAAMVKLGAPPISKWWWRCLERAIRSGRLQHVVRKGRRVGASTIIAPRLLVAVSLVSEHPIPPGDVATIALVSIKRSEASNRLRGIAAVLDAVGVAHTVTSDTIELQSKPIRFQVFTASFRSIVGETMLAAWCDEVSRWRDEASGQNPASEVLASLKPSLATVRGAQLWLVSSPLGLEDLHAKEFDRGDADDQTVHVGTTWEINPTLSKERTRQLEPDLRIWSREYAAEPQAAVSAALDPDHIAGAFRPNPFEGIACIESRPVLTLDPSSGKGDAFTGMLCAWVKPKVGEVYDGAPTDEHGQDVRRWYRHDARWIWERDEHGQPIPRPGTPPTLEPALRFWGIKRWTGKFFGTVSARDIVRDLASHAKSHGAFRVVSDQREALTLQALFQDNGMRFHQFAWSNPSKVAAVERLRRLMADRQIVLPDDETLRRELLGYEERITPSGSITYGGRRGVHDDAVSCVISGLIAEADGLLGGPLGKPPPPRMLGQYPLGGIG
jgi:hypothetical protein